MPLAAGKHLGPYEIVAPIGAGGMGEVYRARDTRRPVHRALRVRSLWRTLQRAASPLLATLLK